MVEEDKGNDQNGVVEEETNGIKPPNMAENYDLYDTDIKAGDFTQTYEPSKRDDSQETTFDEDQFNANEEDDIRSKEFEDDQPKTSVEDEIQPKENADENVIDLKVEPDEPPPPSTSSELRRPPEEVPRATVIYRGGWGALPQKDPPAPKLSHPVDTIIFLHTGPRFTECHDMMECSARLREMQRYHMYDLGYPDIQYNFMVSSDSTVYEGRGWHYSASKDPMYKHYDGRSLDICFIGDYSRGDPPEKMMKAAFMVVGEGINRDYIMKVVNVCRVNTSQSMKIDFGNYMKYMLA